MGKDKLLAAAARHQQRGQWQKCRTALEQASVVDPNDSRVWLALAEVNCRLLAVPAAVEAYGRAADLFRKNGFVRRAVALYKNVLGLAPERLQTRLDLAAATADLGLLSDAAQQYEFVASVLLRAGRAPEAVPVLERWWCLDHNNVAVLLQLAEACLQAGQQSAGQSHLADAAQRLSTQGNLEDYVRVAERLLARDPQSHRLRKSLARAYLDIGKPESALARIAPICHADTQDAEALDLLARGFECQGHIDKAVIVLRAVGEVLHDQGAIAQSLQAYRKILDLKPNDVSAEARVNALGMGFLPEDWRTPTRDLVAGLPVVFPPLVKDDAHEDEVNTEPLFASFKAPTATTPAGNTQARPIMENSNPATAAIHPPFDGDERARTFANDDPTALMQQEVLDAQLQRCDAQPDGEAWLGSAPAPAHVTTQNDPDNQGDRDIHQLLSECTSLMEQMAARLNQVLKISPHHVGARERLAYVLLQLGRAPEAVEHLTRLSDSGRSAEPSWSVRRTEPSPVLPLR